MKSLIYLLPVIVLVLLPLSSLKPQSLNELEKKYNNLRNSYLEEEKNLDSLQDKFNNRVREINLEKDKLAPDKEKIRSLMANSVNLSNNLEQQKVKTDRLIKSIENIKRGLNEKYADVIDSLKNIQNRNKEKNESVEDQILFYAAKRLEVIPGIDKLSFIPGKILELDPNRSKNEVDKKILKEYFLNALNEVNNILADINEENSGIDQIIELQKKTSKFLEEAEFESGVISGKLSQPQLSSAENARQGHDYNGIGTTDKEAAVNLAQNALLYEHLLEQLNTVKSLSVHKPNEVMQTIDQNIDLESYSNLLKEVKKRLTEYKKLLEQKTGSVK